MIRILYFINLLILSAIFTISFAHGNYHGYDPDSLETITVNGYAIVDTITGIHSMYYLDEDNNGTPEYFLNFGPWWYEPDSSNALRPEDTQQITITGGLIHSAMMNNFPVIVVYEIDGEFWRNPFDPLWNHMGTYHGENHFMDSCYTSGFGWIHNQLQTVSLSGHALVDTTFIMEHYYLDENNDGSPDYFLNFGPPWYKPASGAVRPEPGDSINILGGMLSNGFLPMVVVYEINGLTWKDSTNFDQHFGGGWIHQDMNNVQQFHTPFDSLDQIKIYPGWWNGGGSHHGGMHDSLFTQIFEIFPEDINTLGNEHAFAGYEMDFFFPAMMGGGMDNGMGCGGHMNFNSTTDFQFHYTDDQLMNSKITESSVKVKYWNSDTDKWEEVSGANLNTSDNTITFNQANVANFFILTGDSPTSVKSPAKVLPDRFILKQNYPNPFNPTTKIEFSVPQKTTVKLTVYNILGKKIAELANGNYEAGTYSAKFNGQNLSSGVYFYELKTGNFREVKKMQLIK